MPNSHAAQHLSAGDGKYTFCLNGSRTSRTSWRGNNPNVNQNLARISMKRLFILLLLWMLASCRLRKQAMRNHHRSPRKHPCPFLFPAQHLQREHPSLPIIPARAAVSRRHWPGATRPPGQNPLPSSWTIPTRPCGTFVHWVIYNIPASSRGLPEAVPANGQLADGTLQGNNGAGKAGYTGPCPPSGTHRYFFKLYALDNVLSLSSGAGKDQLLKAMQGHILAQGELMGTFSK